MYATKLVPGQNIGDQEVPKDPGIVLAARVGGLAGVPGNIRGDIGNKGWRGKRGAQKKIGYPMGPKGSSDIGGYICSKGGG